MPSRMLVAVTCFVAGIASSSSVAAAQDPDPETVAEFVFTPLEGAPGTVVQISGRCIFMGQPGDDASVLLATDPPDGNRISVASGEESVDDAGNLTGTIRVPDDAVPGPYIFGALCLLQDQAFGDTQVPFTVVAGAESTTTSTMSTVVTPSTEVLARTGTADRAGYAIVALVLVLTGLAIVHLGRRHIARN